MSEQDALTPYRTGRAGRRWRPFSTAFWIFRTMTLITVLSPQPPFSLNK